MKTRYVLVDCENVQPGGFEKLRDDAFKVKMFIGAKQNTPKNAKKALEYLGEHAERIDISGSGKNAADFHIAYYIGRLSVESQDVLFYVVSKDKGFDPLIKHLQLNGVKCARVPSLEKVVPTQFLPKQETAVARAGSEVKPKATKAVPKKKQTAAGVVPKAKPAAAKQVPKKKPTTTKAVSKTKPMAAKATENIKVVIAKQNDKEFTPATSNKEVKKPVRIAGAEGNCAKSPVRKSIELKGLPTTARSDVPNPGTRPNNKMSIASLTDMVIEGLGTGRKPGFLENLERAIKDLLKDLFSDQLIDQRVLATIEEMERRRFITKIDYGIVSYGKP